ncbi:lyase family protein [Glycomyces buryatensis]|uniref:3-carboxy-cis,cis-muconate cycloisomerase n=1 Tax=Glycomyces buryatensis TaxID=2570927 RepID=A0A4S8Q1R1_9ACTN|nr:lyase family protein [Glycomyces buryatensis]THV36372.1 3-carboxy-cis,cis-muconate cycloisomerase [Glycomyces buryatensis]
MSELFGAIFSRGEAAEAVSDAAWLRALLRVEAALSSAAAEAGAVSPGAARAVVDAAKPEHFDLGEVAGSAARIGNPVAGVVDRLRELVPEQHHAAVHYEATSQDILDTAMMLVAKGAVAAILEDLHGCDQALRRLEHAEAVQVVGRTLLQRAQPMSSRERILVLRMGLWEPINQLGELTFPSSYGGPVGDHWELGPDNHFIDIQQSLSETLELESQPVWHTARTPVVRIGSAAAEAAGACGKIAVDIILLSQNEIGEVSEGRPGGSTSMPHKRNPVAATAARACAARTPGLVATLYAAMPQELQRSPGLWHSEWETLSDLLRLTGSSAAWLRESLEHLQVHPDAMKRNLEGGRE